MFWNVQAICFSSHTQSSSNLQLHKSAAGVIWECEDKYDIKGIHTFIETVIETVSAS